MKNLLKGRSSRAIMVAFVFWALLLAFVYGFAYGVVTELELTESVAVIAACVSVGVILLCIFYGLAIRRIHDIGHSGWWILLWLGLYYMIAVLLELGETTTVGSGALQIAGKVLGYVIFFGPLAVLLLVPGKRGENRYGQPPQRKSALIWCLPVSILGAVLVSGTVLVLMEKAQKRSLAAHAGTKDAGKTDLWMHPETSSDHRTWTVPFADPIYNYSSETPFALWCGGYAGRTIDFTLLNLGTGKVEARLHQSLPSSPFVNLLWSNGTLSPSAQEATFGHPMFSRAPEVATVKLEPGVYRASLQAQDAPGLELYLGISDTTGAFVAVGKSVSNSFSVLPVVNKESFLHVLVHGYPGQLEISCIHQATGRDIGIHMTPNLGSKPTDYHGKVVNWNWQREPLPAGLYRVDVRSDGKIRAATCFMLE